MIGDCEAPSVVQSVYAAIKEASTLLGGVPDIDDEGLVTLVACRLECSYLVAQAWIIRAVQLVADEQAEVLVPGYSD